jgi:hypothetical protein
VTNQAQLTFFKILTGPVLLVLSLLAWALFSFSSEPPETLKPDNPSLGVNDNYSIYSLPIPQELSFAGERVPMERNYIRESLDRELLVNTYWQSQTLLFIKRANRYFPIIEPILKEENVPDDFKYLPLIESGLMPKAESPAGAVGLWQIMHSTANDLKLEVNSEVDERYHVVKSTRAACDYLKSAREKFGSWTLAAAAYNTGRANIIKQLTRQKTDNYYDLLLGEETGRYVFRVLAVKEILENPQKYGFHVKSGDLYPVIPTYEVVIDTKINDFADFAREHGVTYRELKDLNPWLRDTNLSNPHGKSYRINLPQEGAFGSVRVDTLAPRQTIITTTH